MKKLTKRKTNEKRNLIGAKGQLNFGNPIDEIDVSFSFHLFLEFRQHLYRNTKIMSDLLVSLSSFTCISATPIPKFASPLI